MKQLDSITDSMDKNLRKLQKIMKDRGAWHAAVHGVTKSWTWLSDWTTTTMNNVARTLQRAVKWSEVKVTQSCPTLCDPMDYTVHGILQASILEWVTFPFSRGSSQLRDWTQVSHIAGGFFTSLSTREASKSCISVNPFNLYRYLMREKILILLWNMNDKVTFSNS